MYAAVVVVNAGPERADQHMDAAVLTDAFWAHTREADGLEHVRVVSSTTGFSAVLFMKGKDEGEVAQSALALCWHTMMATPVLAGCSIESCAVRRSER
ncbi:hypothetical protein ABZ128_15650 [Streptomyces sp. NPDC006326]|uniref:hypothetical protein n=1 Tax=unclassified Streptomyces TaxID=2593676 RepID=UPI0033B246BF